MPSPCSVPMSNYIYIYIHIIDHMLFYSITGPVGRQHMLHWSLNFLFLSFVLCNIKLSNLCNYYFFYLKLKIKSMSMSYTYHGDIHEHNTRHSTGPRSHSVNSNVMRRSFLYMGPIFWMNLDDQVKSSKSKNILRMSQITQNYLRNY